jgi:hypothetical protein
MQSWKKLLFAFATSAALAACGGDDDGSGDDTQDHDANVPDSGIDAWAGATRSLTISVVDVEVTTPSAAAAVTRGGSINIEVEDLTMGGGEVVAGTTPVGGCVVTRYDATHQPHPTVGAGTVTIANPGAEESGLLKTVGPCNYTAGVGYQCISAGATMQDIDTTVTGDGRVAYDFTEQTFAGDLVGSYLNVNGFTDANLNSGSSAFPILANPSATRLTAFNTAATTDQTTATGSFAVINGAGPIPTLGTANADFLGAESDQIHISKPADANFGAIDFTVYTRGEGFALDDASAQPHEFPTTAEAVTFSCGGTGGNCGADADPAGVLEAFIISGRTTDASVEGLADYEMPTPTGTWTTFQCGFLLDVSTEGTIPADAVAAILATNPTRIETRILQMAGTQGEDGDQANPYTVVVGHGVVGHTTIPAQ